MKHLKLLTIVILASTFLISCEKKMGMDDMSVPTNGVKGVEVVDMHMPISTFDTPEIITGENNGGNVTCLEVEAFYGFDFPNDGVNCNKVDYEDFDNGFPEGLIVDVDEANKRLSFRIEGECLEIDGSNYKVGAVIVKGANASNVYFYMKNPTGLWGVTHDENLGSPGGKALVSNLTFCFVPCDVQPEKVIAVKVKSLDDWACTTTDVTDYIEYYPYVPATYKLYFEGNHLDPIGNLLIADTNGDGVLDVTINNVDKTTFKIKHSHLFIGPASSFNTDYLNYPNYLLTNPPGDIVFFDGSLLTIL